MRSVDQTFYHTQEWKKCRESYAKSKKYLCENCLVNGRYTPGVIVHHIKPLNRQNIHNPEISLAFANLQLLCRKCHNQEHSSKKKGIRYEIDEATGAVIVPPDAD